MQTSEQLLAEISILIRPFHGVRGCSDLRVLALEQAGFTVGPVHNRWNFGVSGSVRLLSDGIYVQLRCATGGRGKNGYGVNACPVVKISRS